MGPLGGQLSIHRSGTACHAACASACASHIQGAYPLSLSALATSFCFSFLPPFITRALISVLHYFASYGNILRKMVSSVAETQPAPPHEFTVTQTPLHPGLLMAKRAATRSPVCQRPRPKVFPLQRLSPELLCILFEHVSFPIFRRNLDLDPF